MVYSKDWERLAKLPENWPPKSISLGRRLNNLNCHKIKDNFVILFCSKLSKVCKHVVAWMVVSHLIENHNRIRALLYQSCTIGRTAAANAWTLFTILFHSLAEFRS